MRAVYLEVACGTTTEELMHVIHHALARCSDIKMVICDPGTNQVRASNQLAEWRKGWDQEKLTELGAEKGMEFQFIMANSQHQNGISKAMIKQSSNSSGGLG